MISNHPLQLSQLLLFWEGFLQGLGMFMRIFNLSSSSTLVMSDIEAGQEGLALSLSFNLPHIKAAQY